MDSAGHTDLARGSKEPTIRDAAERDVGAIQALLAQLGYEAGSDIVGNQLGHLIRHPDAELLVAESTTGVVGFVSIHYIPQIALTGAFARISYLCVDERCRSQGIGRMLEDVATRHASERHCDRIELHCHSRRSEAHRFYSRQGYLESPKYLIKMLGRKPLEKGAS